MHWYHFFILFFEGMILSLILTRVMRWIAPAFGFLDQPGARKVHHNPKPLLGGAAIYFAFMITLFGNMSVLNWLFTSDIQSDLWIVQELQTLALYAAGVHRVRPELIGMISGGTLLFIIGLIDDRFDMKPIIKLLGQIFAAIILYFADVQIALFIHQPVINFILTLSWVVLITNSFNLLDNMDGLSGGVAMISAILLGISTHLVSQQVFMSSILFLLAGCIAGFLRYNINPSSIFMGDAGSMLIGFWISSFTIQSTFYQTGTENATIWPIAMPLVILAVPVFDTLTVIVIRIKNNKPIYVGDKNHFSHRLVALGLSHRGAVFFIYLITLMVGSNALVLPLIADPFAGWVVFAQTILFFVIIAILENIHHKKNSTKTS